MKWAGALARLFGTPLAHGTEQGRRHCQIGDERVPDAVLAVMETRQGSQTARHGSADRREYTDTEPESGMHVHQERHLRPGSIGYARYPAEPG